MVACNLASCRGCTRSTWSRARLAARVPAGWGGASSQTEAGPMLSVRQYDVDSGIERELWKGPMGMLKSGRRLRVGIRVMPRPLPPPLPSSRLRERQQPVLAHRARSARRSPSHVAIGDRRSSPRSPAARRATHPSSPRCVAGRGPAAPRGRRANPVDHLAGVFTQRHPLEHYRAADHVPTQAGGGIPIRDLDVPVHRESAVAPGQQVVDHVLGDQPLAHEQPQHLGAKQLLDQVRVEERERLERGRRGEEGN